MCVVCVCVGEWVRERGKERERGREIMLVLFVLRVEMHPMSKESEISILEIGTEFRAQLMPVLKPKSSNQLNSSEYSKTQLWR